MQFADQTHNSSSWSSTRSFHNGDGIAKLGVARSSGSTGELVSRLLLEGVAEIPCIPSRLLQHSMNTNFHDIDCTCNTKCQIDDELSASMKVEF